MISSISGGSGPINLIYSVKDVSDSDIDYFVSSFEIRDRKLRQNYLSVKETIMGLSYRFSHYNPLDRDNYKKKQVDMLLLKWENWFIKAVESSKGVKELKALYLKKRQYEVCGLQLPGIRKKELISGYQNLLYQTEVNERERQGIITEMENFRSKIVGSYPGEFQENLRRFEAGENKRLLNGGLNILEGVPHFAWKPLTEREKLQMVKFMENSYQQFGGSDLGKFNKDIRQNLKDLQSIKDYSALEMSRNIFNPEKSKFLNLDGYNQTLAPIEEELAKNSSTRRLIEEAKNNTDLSKSIIKFIEAERKREGRDEILGQQVGNIVSYLQDNDIDAEKLHDISQLLLKDDKEYLSPEEKKIRLEELAKKREANKPKGILKNKDGKGKFGESEKKDKSKKSKDRKKRDKSKKSKDRKKKDRKDKSKSKDKKKKDRKAKSKDKKKKDRKAKSKDRKSKDRKKDKKKKDKKRIKNDKKIT